MAAYVLILENHILPNFGESDTLPEQAVQEFVLQKIENGLNLSLIHISLKRIEDSTLGQDREEDFGGLFSDIDLASPKLGKTADDKNTLVSNVPVSYTHLNEYKFLFVSPKVKSCY